MSGADLILKPFPGIIPTVSKQDGAWGNLSDKIQKVFAIGVGGEVKVLHITLASNPSGTWAEDKSLAWF